MSKKNPKWGKSTQPPEGLKIGTKSIAKIVSLNEGIGKYGHQVEVKFKLDDYEGRDWIRWNDSLSDRTDIYRLCKTIENTLNIETESPKDALMALEKFGHVYVIREADRVDNGKNFAKFRVDLDDLPQTPTSTLQPQKLQ